MGFETSADGIYFLEVLIACEQILLLWARRAYPSNKQPRTLINFLASWLLLEECKILCKVRTNGADSSVYEGLESLRSIWALQTSVTLISEKYLWLFMGMADLDRFWHVYSCPAGLGHGVGSFKWSSKENSILGRSWFVFPALPTSFLKELLPPKQYFLTPQYYHRTACSARTRYGSIHGAKCLQIFSLLTISIVAAPPRAKGQVIHPILLLYFK